MKFLLFSGTREKNIETVFNQFGGHQYRIEKAFLFGEP